jgi:hypothetical protein
MNCDNFQNLLSELVDSESMMSAEAEAHIGACQPCANVYRDFSELTHFCAEYQEEEVAPPNSQALWCRISNIIETEIQPAEPVPAAAEKKNGIFAGVWKKNWQLSFSQMVTAVIGIALVSSLLTIIGIKNVMRPAGDVTAAAAGAQPSLFDTLLSKVGIQAAPEEIREKNMADKQVVIDYWNSRVAARKVQWNAKLRDTFDRNLHEIDQVLGEYSQNLKENPQDSLSEEMMNSAMNEKVEMLREFSEL